MSAEMMLILPILLAMSGLFSIVPTLSRPDLFFAVTVPPEFRKTAEGRGLLTRFRIVVWIATLLAIAVQWVWNLPLVALLILAAGYMGALVISHRQALAYAVAASATVEVDLSAPEERLPGGLIVMLIPMLSIVAAGIWASLHRGQLPDKLPIHWGIHGADRWVPTTPGTIVGLLFLQAVVCIFLIASAWGTLHWSRRISTTGESAADERGFRRRILWQLIAVEYFLALPVWFSFFQPSATSVNTWGIALVVLVIAFTIALVRSGQGGSRGTVASNADPVGDRTPDDCWKWGLFYVNPADPSILVEKRFGIGYTINFGNRRAWVALVLVGLPIAAAAIFLR